VSTDTAEVWHRVREVRLDLADRVDGLDQEQAATPSLCEGWRVRDVVGHLVHLAEATQLSMARDVARNGPSPQRALGRVAVRLGDLPLDELASRLRGAADGRFRIVGLPPATVLGEVVVHREDALRPLGITVDVDPASLVPVLDLYVRIGRVAFGRSLRGVTLAATDVTWQTGSGPVIEGPALELLLLLAGRRAPLRDLRGPGLGRVGGEPAAGPVVDPPA